jgi:hypothetical protein
MKKFLRRKSTSGKKKPDEDPVVSSVLSQLVFPADKLAAVGRQGEPGRFQAAFEQVCGLDSSLGPGRDTPELGPSGLNIVALYDETLSGIKDLDYICDSPAAAQIDHQNLMGYEPRSRPTRFSHTA